MEICLETPARKYILKKDKNNAVTIFIGERPQICCVEKAFYPAVRLGKVESHQMSNYRKVNIDGIEVYYLERLPQIFPNIKIAIEKFLFFKKLVAIEGRNG